MGRSPSRLLAALALALASVADAAEWSAVGKPDAIYAAYADKASIRRNGAIVSMHGLYDFRRQDFTPEGFGLHSTVVLREYDCDDRRVRLLFAIDFSGHMGEGTAVSTNARTGRWEAVVADGIDEQYWLVACAVR